MSSRSDGAEGRPNAVGADRHHVGADDLAGRGPRRRVKALFQTDAFTEAVTCATAARAGDRCSNPKCRALTSGPHNDRRQSLTLGLAVHIAAVSSSRRRCGPSLPDREHGSYDNAIWRCQNCANVIDNDVVLYLALLLRTWQREAEENVGGRR